LAGLSLGFPAAGRSFGSRERRACRANAKMLHSLQQEAASASVAARGRGGNDVETARHTSKSMLSSSVCPAAFLFALGAANPAGAQTVAALAGTVSSQAESAMEGVVVSARRDGDTKTISVVSDDKGRYAFPASKIEPGHYTLKMRATGFDLDGAPAVDVVAGQTATADIKLKPTRKLAAQLTNAEWMMSAPGPEEQRAALLDCQTCHTLERIFMSTHDSDEFTQLLTRMANYASVSFWLKPQTRVLQRATNPEQFRKMADYLASINLSAGEQREYPLKTLPRVRGRGTHVVITEYDMPRRTIQPHDVVLDKDGMAWYTDFGDQILGKLDPKTGKVTEYKIPTVKAHEPTGSLVVEIQDNGKLLVGMMYQGSIGEFDPKTGEWKIWPMPPDLNHENAQLNQVTTKQHVDGKVWTNTNDGTGDIMRLDVNTGKYEKFKPLTVLPGGPSANAIYQVSPDKQNNAWLAEFRNNYIGRIDAKTGEATFYPVPTDKSRNRRGRMDEQDRFWFAEYRGK
jgi:virginiamycin B lyase